VLLHSRRAKLVKIEQHSAVISFTIFHFHFQIAARPDALIPQTRLHTKTEWMPMPSNYAGNTVRDPQLYIQFGRIPARSSAVQVANASENAEALRTGCGHIIGGRCGL